MPSRGHAEEERVISSKFAVLVSAYPKVEGLFCGELPSAHLRRVPLGVVLMSGHTA
jgi:hypothetical protein